MSAASGKRPCTLPSIQIDTWHIPEAVQSCTADDLAQAVCKHRIPLLAGALLKGAKTIRQLAVAICYARTTLHVRINSGQIYMHDKWRIRYSQMDKKLRTLVLSCPSGVQLAFEKHYDSDVVEKMMFTAMGPARAEAVRALLPMIRASGHLPTQ